MLAVTRPGRGQILAPSAQCGGMLIKEGDDLMCATRYGLMMLRYAKTKSFADKWRREISTPISGSYDRRS